MSKAKKNRNSPEPEEKLTENAEAAEEAEEAEAAAAEEAEGTPEEQPKPEADGLQAELDKAREKTAEYLAMAQRVQADFENFRKRNESVRADAYADGRKDVAAAMLPVLDNLERAVAAAEGSADEALKNGVTLVLKQMNEVYQKLEVTPIDRLGEKFDPNLENAILQGTPEDGEPGTVCQVLQKGYRMGDRVLRHAMVKVVPE